MHNLFKSVNPLRILADGTNYELAAGNGDTPATAGVDTMGYDAVAFEVLLGAMSAGATVAIKAQQSNDNGVTDAWSDLTGSNTGQTLPTVTNASQRLQVLIEIFEPQKRYIRLMFTRAGGANTAVDAVVAHLFLAGNVPVVLNASVASSVFLNSPGPGTA